MNVKFTRPQLKRLRQALYIAADSEEAAIDAHRTGLRNRKGVIQRYVPSCHRETVRMSQRSIIAWDKLRMQINGILRGDK